MPHVPSTNSRSETARQVFSLESRPLMVPADISKILWPSIAAAEFRALVEEYPDPFLGQTLGSAQAVELAELKGDRAHVRVVLGFPVGGYQEEFTRGLQGTIWRPRGGPANIEVELVPEDHRTCRAAAAVAAGWRAKHRGGRLGQGRRRQVHGCSKPCARLGAAGRASRHPRCRHLWAEPAHHAGAHGPAARLAGRQAHQAAHGAWAGGHVHRLSHRSRAAHGLARPDGHAGADPAARRHRLGRPRLPGDRHAAGHRRHPAHAGAARAGGGRRHRDHAAGHRAGRCAQGPQDVREGQRAGARHRREHERACVQQLRPRGTPVRRRRRRAHGRAIRRRAAGRAAARRARARGSRWRSADRGRGAGFAARRAVLRHGAPHRGGARAPLEGPFDPVSQNCRRRELR